LEANISSSLSSDAIIFVPQCNGSEWVDKQIAVFQEVIEFQEQHTPYVLPLNAKTMLLTMLSSKRLKTL